MNSNRKSLIEHVLVCQRHRLKQWRSVAIVSGIGVFLSVQSVLSPAVAQKALQDKLKDVRYWSNLCKLQADAGKLEDAIAACEQAIVLRPKAPILWADHSGVLLKLKKYPDAIASADKALSFDAKTSLALTYKCMAFEALGQREAALDGCNQALKVDGNWGTQSPALAWLHRGVILAQQSQYDAAAIAFDRTLILTPKDSLTLAYRCDVLVKLGQYTDAITACDHALSGNGNWGDRSAAFAWMIRGTANQQLKRIERAIADYDQAINLDPNNVTVWTSQALLLEQLARSEEALTSYNRAVQIAPKSTIALLGRCTTLNRLKQYKEALDACEQALQGDGIWREFGAAQAWNQRSQALVGLGKYEDAIASANRAVGLKPDYAQAWSDRSVPFWYLKRYEEAIASVQQAIRLQPEFAQAWLNQARILRAMGNSEGALTAYETALKLDPTNSDGWSNFSVLLWRLNRLDDAIAATNKAIRFNPDSVQGWYNQGVVLADLGQLQAALTAYDRAIKLSPKNPAVLTGRGVILSKLKRYPDAIAALQVSLKLNPDQPLAQETLKSTVQLQHQSEQKPQPKPVTTQLKF